MRLFGKRKFLQMIKQKLPSLQNIHLSECKYTTRTFSEWLEFEYGNYYYVFYHAKRWGDEKITYRKSYFDAIAGKQRAPYEISELLLQIS